MTKLAKRQGLSREIAYRPHVRVTYFIGWLITLAAISPFVRALLNRDLYQQPLGLVLAFLGFNLLAVGSLIAALFFMHQLAFKKFKVQPDKLDIIVQGKVVATLDYRDIESLRFAHIPLLLGMFTIVLKNKREYIFTMAIERSEYILDAIYSARPELFAIEKLQDYRLSSVVVDHAAHRLEKRARNWQRFIIKFLLYPGLAAAAYFAAHILRGDKYQFVDYAWGWAYSIWAHLLLSVLIYSIYDSIIIRQEKEKLRQNPNDLRVDLAKEKHSEQRAQLIFYGLSVLLFFPYLFASL